jgi:hypothetical protein
MHAKTLAAWTLAAFGAVLLGVVPVSAAEWGDSAGRRQPAATSQHRAATAHARGVQATQVSRSGAGQRGTLRAEKAPPMRGRLAVSHDQQAAVSQGSACSGKHSRCVSRMMSWTQGLAPADGLQAAECPDGTMATLARGHDDIIRCMPI